RGDLQTWHRKDPVLDRLGVLGAEPEAATVSGPNHERDSDLTARHVAHLGNLVGQIVVAACDEVREHDLRDRPHPCHRGAERGADDGLLRDRRVPDALWAELGAKPGRRFEDSFGGTDVLPEAHDARVATHLAGDALRDSLAI